MYKTCMKVTFSCDKSKKDDSKDRKNKEASLRLPASYEPVRTFAVNPLMDPRLRLQFYNWPAVRTHFLSKQRPDKIGNPKLPNLDHLQPRPKLPPPMGKLQNLRLSTMNE